MIGSALAGVAVLTGCKADIDLVIESDQSLQADITVTVPRDSDEAARLKEVVEALVVQLSSDDRRGGPGECTDRTAGDELIVECRTPSFEVDEFRSVFEDGPSGLNVTQEDDLTTLTLWQEEPLALPAGIAIPQLNVTVTMPGEIVEARADAVALPFSGSTVTLPIDLLEPFQVRVVSTPSPASSPSEPAAGEESPTSSPSEPAAAPDAAEGRERPHIVISLASMALVLAAAFGVTTAYHHWRSRRA